MAHSANMLQREGGVVKNPEAPAVTVISGPDSGLSEKAKEADQAEAVVMATARGTQVTTERDLKWPKYELYESDPVVRQTRRCQTSSAPVLPEGISSGLINDEFLKDGLQSVSGQKIAHSSHDEC
ncbi:hypothetical protein JOQ06_025585 [Pogonophryne albipinna]|uniref:Uncharacterized protein n=1 Tax=Pogonophryne albipinna TaxID=1090488 RepID=A0AAD6ASR2_9TELE|nr:hypothetical protein JOQ06_025585 [Pogonophryne albipinna]